MVSEEEKKGMFTDARDPQRRKDFAYARQLVEDRKLTGEEFLRFLNFERGTYRVRGG